MPRLHILPPSGRATKSSGKTGADSGALCALGSLACLGLTIATALVLLLPITVAQAQKASKQSFQVGTWRLETSGGQTLFQIKRTNGEYHLNTISGERGPVERQSLYRWSGRNGWHFETLNPPHQRLLLTPSGQLQWHRPPQAVQTLQPSDLNALPKTPAPGIAGLAQNWPQTRISVTPQAFGYSQRDGVDVVIAPQGPRPTVQSNVTNVVVPLGAERASGWSGTNRGFATPTAFSDPALPVTTLGSVAEADEAVEAEPTVKPKRRIRRAVTRSKPVKKRMKRSLAASFEQGD